MILVCSWESPDEPAALNAITCDGPRNLLKFVTVKDSTEKPHGVDSNDDYSGWPDSPLIEILVECSKTKLEDVILRNEEPCKGIPVTPEHE